MVHYETIEGVNGMQKFEKEQEIFEVGNIKIGGQPGQLPTVMIGSIFYHGDKVVKDERAGTFDKQAAESLLNDEAEIAERTGMKRIVDVVGSFPDPLIKYVDFVAEHTDSPFLVDGTNLDVRLPAVKHVGEVGLADRVIYNSIIPDLKPKERAQEIDAIKDSGIKSAILLTFNPKNPSIDGRLGVMEELLDVANKAGVDKPLVDTTTLDVPDPGPVSKAIFKVKEEYGLPAGSGVHNAIECWHKKRPLDKTRYLMSTAVAFTSTIMMGADLILYGPIERALDMYNTCALADAYVAYSMKQEYRISPIDREHPLFKIFAA